MFIPCISQVNPHVVALSAGNLGAHKHHGAFNWLRHAELSLLPAMLEGMRALSSMQLLPALYGAASSKSTTPIEFNQKYSGDVTILPRLGGPDCLLRALQNPNPKLMRHYIR